MPKRRKGRTGRVVLKAISIIALVLMMLAATYTSYVLVMRLLDTDPVREGFDKGDLRAPISSGAVYEQDPAPTFIRGGPAPPSAFSISFPVNGTTKKLEAIPGLGGIINLTMINEGATRIYVERMEVSAGWGPTSHVAVGRAVGPGESRYMRHFVIPMPVPAPPEGDLHFSMSFDILIGPLIEEAAWTRRTGVEFGMNEVQISPVSNVSVAPDVRMNRAVVYDRVLPHLREDLPLLRSIAENISDDGIYTEMDIVEAALYLENTLEYISDPDGKDVWSSPSETLAAGGGDCEDWSVLYGGLIAVMGGSARVMLNGRHVMCSVYIGDDDSVLDPIFARFGADIPLLIYEDALGKWLIVDPQGGPSFGWFPVNTEPTDALDPELFIYKHPDISWHYTDPTILYIVDIYL